MEMLEQGQGCGDEAWTTLAVRNEREEHKYRNNLSTPDFSPQFNNEKVKAACIILPRA